MSNHRELEEDLVELALGEVAEPRRSELLSHLTGCARCRASYGEIVTAVDATVPAAPEAQPPAGFDLRVLHAMGVDHPDEGDLHRRRSLRTRAPRLLLAAAAVLAVVAAGIIGGTVVGDRDAQVAQPPAAAAGTTVLRTGDGERVGTAAVAWMEDDRVLVMAVSDAPVGVAYTCQVQLANGDSRDLGRWEAHSPDGGTWVVPAPQGDLAKVVLVTDSGHVWSSARLS